MLLRIYRHPNDRKHSFEECFYVAQERAFTPREFDQITWLLSEPGSELKMGPEFRDGRVTEIGPRLTIETPFSSSAVAICRSMELPVRRVERSVRHAMNGAPFDGTSFDKMTQEIYGSTLASFDEEREPEPVRSIDVLARGEAAVREANTLLGLGMDDWDIAYYTNMFRSMRRDPTDVELMQVGNANSEHSRHWFFRGVQVIDGVDMPHSLMDIVKEPWKRNPGNSLVAFRDNAGVIRGVEVDVFLPQMAGHISPFMLRRLLQHITATAETHNHPTLIAPFPGAETGAGGRIRDNRAVGRGGLVHAGVAGYSVGNLHIPGHLISGERVGGEQSRRHASPLEILIQGSNGVSDYGNKIGEPLIGGYTRSYAQIVCGVRREYRKPILYTGGLGRVLDMHMKKFSPEQWSPAHPLRIVRIGGPAYPIGVGGGSASSMIHGSQGAELDFKSVQRGNAEMENRANRVIQACAELLERNPIESIHDQGAGGPSNVLTELMEPVGGRVNIRHIVVGDRTMSVLEIWVAEYQEGYGLLVRPENIDLFKAICLRERVNCEVLGDITGDGNVVVYDSAGDTTPVNLSLKDILGELPQKRFESRRLQRTFRPLEIPDDLTVDDALRMVCTLPQVGSKGFLVHKVDRSVTGLVAGQQCCGPMQVPVADVGITADGYFGLTGAATALGEQPIKMLIDPAAGARMTVAEMFTNLCSARITGLRDVKCRANWMWAAKRPGEGALLYDAAVATRDILLELGVAIDGGKDSLSMATQLGEELVVSPGTLVVMGYAPVPDIRRVTPDLKAHEMSYLSRIDLGRGKNRLGGSSFAQALGQLGDEPPDIDEPGLLRRAFEAMQELIERRLISAYHDVSDGGLITTVAEMCIAGNCGAAIGFETDDILATLFSEEAGMVFQYRVEDASALTDVLRSHDVPRQDLGAVIPGMPELTVRVARKGEPAALVLDTHVGELRQWWEETSLQLELQQTARECVEAERRSHSDMRMIEYKLSFTPKAPALTRVRAPKVAILREEGTNGEREMAAAFYAAGLEPVDIAMSDLLDGAAASLDDFRGLVFPGGFSYADVFGSAKGWAGPIRFNPRIRDIFDRFYGRQDTFSLGVCNGCQLMAQIGRLPYSDGVPESSQTRLVHNTSGRFESRWVGVKIRKSPSILLRGMDGSVLGINVAHGEGRFHFPDERIHRRIIREDLVPLVYVDADGKATMRYPHNPNGSPGGIAALCSADGRHLAMMPHPERSFLTWQWHWWPERFRDLDASPWLQMFQNALTWCHEH